MIAGAPPDDLNRYHFCIFKGCSLEGYFREQPFFRARRFTLVEDQVSRRVEDDSRAIALHRLDHMGMVPDCHRRPGINRSPREGLLVRIGSRVVLPAMVHGDDNHVGTLSKARHIHTHLWDVRHGNSRVSVRVVAVIRVVRVGQKTKLDTVAQQDTARVRFVEVCSCTCNDNTLLPEAGERQLQPLEPASRAWLFAVETTSIPAVTRAATISR